MKTRTLEDLTAAIDNDLGWRKKELTSLRFLAETVSSEQRPGLIRASIAILYAHWEGFVRYASTAYLAHVAVRRIPYNELQPSLAALAFKHEFAQIRAAHKPQAHTDCLKFILSNMGCNSDLPWERAVNTRANLSFQVLQEILHILHLDTTFYEPKRKLIDEKLLKHRNQIAHGRDLMVDYQDMQLLHAEVVCMLDRLRDEIERAASKRDYCVSIVSAS